MTEFLYGIRVIKFYSWESYFINRINEIREKELEQLKAKKYLDAGCVYFWACTPILMSVATFTTYILIGNMLSPSKVFTSLALFNMLINPLNSFPWVINGLIQAWVSLKRIQEFLNLENLNWLTYYSFNELSVISINPGLCIDIRNSQFYWKKSVDSNAGNLDPLPKIVLHQINLKVKRGNFFINHMFILE
jgi:ATP-binding cassette subfamily C (CFTR/MRP) protein 10